MISAWWLWLACLSPLSTQPAVAHDTVTTPHVRIQLLSEQAAVRPGQPLWLALRFTLQPEWHTYWENPGDSGEAPRIVWDLPAGFAAGDIHWPTPERLPVGPLMNFGYSGEAWLLVPISTPARVATEAVAVRARATWLVCREDCIPERGEFELSLPVAGEGATVDRNGLHAAEFARARARLPRPLDGPRVSLDDFGAMHLWLRGIAEEELRAAWFFPRAYGVLAHAEPQVLTRAGNQAALRLAAGDLPLDPAGGLAGVLVVEREGAPEGHVEAYAINAMLDEAVNRTVPDVRFIAALAMALGGGLLLNLMPCVFPVLSLKALHLARHGRDQAARTRASALAFTAGVLLSFLIVAGLLLLLRAGGAVVGWGFQLQSPAFVAALAWLMLALALWLSGVWSLGAGWMGVGQQLAARPGYAGEFFTGVLAVVVATPCTAPFMGVALGYALAQPPLPALAVFLALGAGMALPWLLIALFPALAHRLPRPGAWMERFKQLLAFPLYATAAWLLWVLSQQVDARGLALALTGLLAVAFLAWSLEWVRVAGRRRATPWGALAGLALLLLLARGIDAEESPISPVDGAVAGTAWEPYDAARLDALRARGAPVLVDFTAAWCITCQVNERVALDTTATRAVLATLGATRMKADWTRHDPAITRVLETHGRSGVPLVLFYPPGGGEPQAWPSVLTESWVLTRLRAAMTPDHDPR